MKLQNKNLILIIIAIIILVLGTAIITYTILNNEMYDNNPILDETDDNNFDNNVQDDLIDDNYDDNYDDDDDFEYEIIRKKMDYALKTDSFKFDDIITWTEEEVINDSYYLDLAVTGIILNGETTTLNFNNLPASAYCSNDGLVTEMLINGKVVHSHQYEACYMHHFATLFILDDKFIGIYELYESGGGIYIYDHLGNEVYKNDYAIDFDADNYTFKSYEENNEKYILNTYKLEFKNNQINHKFVSKGTTSYCDMLCEGEPCC